MVCVIKSFLTVVVLGRNNGIRAKSEICTIPIDDQGMYQEVVCWERANRNPLVQDLIRISRELAQEARAERMLATDNKTRIGNTLEINPEFG